MTRELATEDDNSPEALFRAKITDRIRSDIGDLMPDEMLRKLVTDAVQAELYKDMRRDHFGSPKPWIQEVVRERIQGMVSAFVQEELTLRESEVRKMFEQAIRDSFPRIFAAVMIEAVKANNFNMQNAVQDFLRDAY